MRRSPFESDKRVLRALLTACLVLTFGAPAFGQASDGPISGPARELWVEGNQFWAAGDYARAADRFDRAYEIDHSPLLGLWVARSLSRAGRLMAASTRYLELSQQNLPSDASAKDWAAKREAQVERQQLLPRIPSVVVAIEGAAKEEVSVSIDGQPLPLSSFGLQRQVEPGPILVRGVKGERVVEARVEVVEGEVKPVRLTFTAPAPPKVFRPREHARGHHGPARPATGIPDADVQGSAGDGRRLVGYVAMGVGGAALLTGSVFGVLSLDDETRLIDQCPGSRCPASLSSDVDAYESKKTIATVGLISGAALAATGVVLYLTAPRAKPSPKVGLIWLGQGAGLRGAF